MKIMTILAGLFGFNNWTVANAKKPNLEIYFEIQSPTALSSTARLSLVSFGGMGPVRIETQAASGTGVLIISQAELVHPQFGSHALIIENGASLAQVFELPANYTERFEWSEWQPPSYFEDSKTADWHFMDKKTQGRLKFDSSKSPEFKMRFKVRAFNLEQEVRDTMDAREKATVASITQYEQEILKGNLENACSLIAINPRATQAQFMACKKNIESQKSVADKWSNLKKFMKRDPGGGPSFVSWYDDQYSNVKTEKRDWAHKKNGVPESEQVWFLTTFFSTWLKAGDTEFLADMPDIRFCIRGMNTASWNKESYSFLRKELPTLVQERVKKVDPKNTQQNSKQEVAWLLEAISELPK